MAAPGAEIHAHGVEHLQGAVAGVDQVRSPATLGEWTLGTQLKAVETYLAHPLAPLVVAVAHAQVEHPGHGVAELGREGTGIEVGVGQMVVVDHADGSAGRSHGAEMVGIGDLHALEPPEQALRRVAADDDIVALVADRRHPGVVGGHARRVAQAAREPLGLVDGERTGAHHGHFVARTVLALVGAHHQPLHAVDQLLQPGLHHQFARRDKQQVAHEHRFVSHHAHLDIDPPKRQALYAELPVGIGRRALERISIQHHYGGPGQGQPRVRVDHPSAKRLHGPAGRFFG
jgi:hypothetical protein